MTSIKKRIAAGILCFLSALSLSACDLLTPSTPTPDDNGNLTVQAASSSYENSNYESVMSKLKKCGFTNFRINYMNDVIIGFLVTEDSVETISINGKTNFEKGESFDAKSVITMEVHSKHGGSDIYASVYNGEAPIMYGNSELNGQNMLTAAQQFKNIGFTNISYEPIMDCSSANDSKMNTVSGLTVAGKNTYYYYDCFTVDAPIKISYHTVVGDYCTNGLEHTLTSGEGVAATCTEPGWTAGSYCTVCNKSMDDRTEIPPKGHTVVVDKAGYPATCVSTGLSDESHCSVCNAKISEQRELPIDLENHANVETTKGYAATCISTGLTDKVVCNDCKKTVTDQEIIPIDPSNHTNIVETGVIRPSNGNDGNSGSSHCEGCNAVISQGTTISWSGSAEEKQAINELEAYFPKELAKKAVLTAMCNYFSTDVFDSSGNYVVASKLHNYAYASRKFSISVQGTWKWAGENKWRFEGFTIRGGDYSGTYPLYGYISMDSTQFHLTGVNNGKSSNPSQYITYSDSTCFNFSKSLVS